MGTRLKYKSDTRSKIITTIIIIALLALFGVVILISLGSYFSAWLFAFIISIILIYTLSIPRHIDINDDSVEIHCLLELTSINIEDVTRVRTLQNKDMQGCIPIWGSFGFFGYYGYYLNLKNMELVKLYTRSWGNFVEILDSYGQKYIISCPNPQEFVDLVIETKSSFKSN